MRSEDIPFLGNFGRNAAGMVVLVVMILILVFWLSSSSGISPITNSTIANTLGCDTCSPTGGPAGMYFAIRWLGYLTMAFIPFIFIMGFIALQERRERAGPQLLRTQEPLEPEE